MISVIKNVILRNFRSPKYLIFSAVFPIFLILIIGGLLGNYSTTGSNGIKTTTVYYNIANASKNSKEVFDIMKKNINNGDVKFDFINSNDESTALKEVKLNGDVYLKIDKNNVEIYTIASDNNSYIYLKSMLEGIDKGIIVGNEVYKNDYMNAENIMKEKGEIPVSLMKKTEAPTGFDYYSVVEMTMMCLYVITFPIAGYFYDKKKRIKERIALSGINNRKYIIGSTLGYFILSFFITAPGFLVTNIVLKSNWGSHKLIYYIAIELLAFVSILVGTLIITLIEDKEKIMTIIQGAILPILSFLGGAYIQLPYTGNTDFFGYLTYISPLRWINKGIFLSIYNGKNELLFGTMIGFVIAIIVLMGLVLLFTKKDEVRI